MLGVVIAVASFNRETAIFIPAVFGIHLLRDLFEKHRFYKRDLPQWLWGAGYVIIWLVIFLGLRTVFGNSPHVVSLSQQLSRNLDRANIYKSITAVFLFFGLFWILIPRGYPAAPKFIKTTAWILPFYIATYILWNLWYETRVFMTMYPVVVPLGLSAVFPVSDNDT
jgi:hypothetical protein